MKRGVLMTPWYTPDAIIKPHLPFTCQKQNKKLRYDLDAIHPAYSWVKRSAYFRKPLVLIWNTWKLQAMASIMVAQNWNGGGERLLLVN
jgi:hypothetical protein